MIEPSEELKDLIWEVEKDLDVFFWGQELDLEELRKRVIERAYSTLEYHSLRAMYINVYCQMHEEKQEGK
jgi:hypothetical protein